MSKKCWNPPDSPQSWTLTVIFCHMVAIFVSFILISHVCSHCEYFWTIPRPLLGVFPCLPTVIFMTVVVLNVFTGASLCLCGCFCIFGGLSTLNCNLAFLCNQWLWSHVWENPHLWGFCGCSAISMFILLILLYIHFTLYSSYFSLCWSIFTVWCYCLVFAFLWQFLKDTSSFRLCCMALYCFLFSFTWFP